MIRLTLQLSFLRCCLFNLPTSQSLAFSAQTTSYDKSETNLIHVRFSLYPNVAKENPPSMKHAVTTAVGRLGELGVSIYPDDVATTLVGSESTLFEALRTCFARASLTSNGNPRGISMQATFSTDNACLTDNSSMILPIRSAKVDSNREFVTDAYLQPPRIAAHFAIYPMGTTTRSSSYLTTAQLIQDNAKRFSCWKHSLGKLSAMLDGDGNQVFDVLRESWGLARQETETLEMTLTLTANKNAWPEQDRSPVLE